MKDGRAAPAPVNPPGRPWGRTGLNADWVPDWFTGGAAGGAPGGFRGGATGGAVGGVRGGAAGEVSGRTASGAAGSALKHSISNPRDRDPPVPSGLSKRRTLARSRVSMPVKTVALTHGCRGENMC